MAAARGTDKQTVVSIFVEIFLRYGKDIVAWVGDMISSTYRRYFRNRNILVLGAKQTGKTSLLNFLSTGKPYEESDTGRGLPNPTSGAIIVGRKTKVNNEWLKAEKDVGGDKAFRHLWAELIRDLKPEGIIYMLDGRQSDEELKQAIGEMRSDVLSHFETDKQRLVGIHIFLNFADKWADSPREIRRRKRVVQDAVDNVLDGNRVIEQIRFDVSETHLDPNAKRWTATNRAIHRFGAMLME